MGLIGGTMGLLTGFSILSGVEIVYFIIRFFSGHFPFLCFRIQISLTLSDKFSILRFFMSLKISRAELVSAVSKRFENHLTRRD